MRVVELRGSPEEIGLTHGKELAESIRRFTRERLRLASDGSWTGVRTERSEILDVVAATIPEHEVYDPDVHAEVVAMAEVVGLSVAELLLVGGFTDFVDLLKVAVAEDDCTAILVPRSHADAPYLAQTWDMHDTAGQFIVMFRIEPDKGPASLVYTTAGCVGQIGMNEVGICVGINNLSAGAGQIGVTWPYVVRKALAQTNLDDALSCIADAPLVGGHNYLLMDAEGQGFNIEAMPGRVAVDELGTRPMVHTNHCLHSSTKALEAARPSHLTKSSHARYDRATELTGAGELDVNAMWAVLSDETAICRRSSAPDYVESCGGVVMRPSTREVWASGGIPADTVPVRFAL